VRVQFRVRMQGPLLFAPAIAISPAKHFQAPPGRGQSTSVPETLTKGLARSQKRGLHAFPFPAMGKMEENGHRVGSEKPFIKTLHNNSALRPNIKDIQSELSFMI